MWYFFGKVCGNCWTCVKDSEFFCVLNSDFKWEKMLIWIPVGQSNLYFFRTCSTGITYWASILKKGKKNNNKKFTTDVNMPWLIQSWKIEGKYFFLLFLFTA